MTVTILGQKYARRPAPKTYDWGWFDLELQNIQRSFAKPPAGAVVTDLTTYLANNAVVNPLDFGALGNDSNDDTAAILRARDRISTSGPAFGGAVYFPPGYVFKTSAKIPGKRNVAFIGSNPTGIAAGTTYNGVSVIHGAHNDNAIIDLSGIHGAQVANLQLFGDQTFVPKTALLLGRTSAASAGFHRLLNVSGEGYFSKAVFYSIASEENHWDRPKGSIRGGGAKYVFYTSQGDDLAVAGLTGSSNIGCDFYNPWFSSDVNDATSSLIYMNVGAGTWNWNFHGGYLLPRSGAYVTINTGSVDAADCPGSLNFLGVSGETNTGGLNPISGFNLTSPAAYALNGLKIIGSSFQLDAAGYMLRQGANLTLKNALAFIEKSRSGVGHSLIAAQIADSFIADTITGKITHYGDFQTTGKFGCNTMAPQAAYSVGAAAIDAATTQALANNLRSALIANGIAA